jgi:diguanylate cyclase (GGDEF)-like protein/PAS domain S-box-containing protein
MDDRYLLDTFMEHTPDHVYFKDEKSRFIRVSQALARSFGLDNANDVIGRTDFDFFGDEHARKAFADEQHLMRTGEALVSIEEREIREHGVETWASTTKVPLHDRAGRIVGLFGISRDITARKLSEFQLAGQAAQLAKQSAELERLTLADDLTGLCNRRGLAAFGEQALYRARREGTMVALLYLDLDGLKKINDTYGHGEGDSSLRALAGVIRGTIRESDIAARIGGDEFCILLFDDAGASVDHVAKRIRDAAAAARETYSLATALSISIGTLRVEARTPGSIDELLSEADKSMYAEKVSKLDTAASNIAAAS